MTATAILMVPKVNGFMSYHKTSSSTLSGKFEHVQKRKDVVYGLLTAHVRVVLMIGEELR